jgi:hypothetical protein
MRDGKIEAAIHDRTHPYPPPVSGFNEEDALIRSFSRSVSTAKSNREAEFAARMDCK